MKKVLLIQPGAFGDIIVCAPIAKWYADKGYEVFWPVREKFMSHVREFKYVTPIILGEEVLDKDWLKSDVMKALTLQGGYDKVLNLADRGPHSTAERASENFEQCKYRLAEVPFTEKHNLAWDRNEEREDAIYERYVGSKKEYIFVHNSSSHNETAELPKHLNKPIIYCDDPKGYNIFDWYKVATNASEIYCTESSVWVFLDGIVHELTKERFLLSRQGLTGGKHYTISTHWKKDYLK